MVFDNLVFASPGWEAGAGGVPVWGFRLRDQLAFVSIQPVVGWNYPPSFSQEKPYGSIDRCSEVRTEEAGIGH